MQAAAQCRAGVSHPELSRTRTLMPSFLATARASLSTRRRIGNTGSSRLPKFSFTMRLPASIRAARSSAWERSRSVTATMITGAHKLSSCGSALPARPPSRNQPSGASSGHFAKNRAGALCPHASQSLTAFRGHPFRRVLRRRRKKLRASRNSAVFTETLAGRNCPPPVFL